MTPAELEQRQTWFLVAGVVLGAAAGLGLPQAAVRLDPLVVPALVVLLYSTFLQVPLVRLRAALGAKRFLGGLLAINFLAVPLLVWGLLALVPAQPAVRLGVLLVLLTPCIDYVVAFTRSGGGDAAGLLAATPVLLLVQLVLLPVYLGLFLGGDFGAVIDPAPFVAAFVLYILLPLAGAALTEREAARRPAVARWARAPRCSARWPRAVSSSTFPRAAHWCSVPVPGTRWWYCRWRWQCLSRAHWSRRSW
ncbi:hypothetical protein PC39_10452 [Salinisphaera sp. PC39]|uniref:bile acid:sodium symporter n=1 Tax=Salinisphaera sp. PC39 TaxID=1304156 RepID=UPI00333F7936